MFMSFENCSHLWFLFGCLKKCSYLKIRDFLIVLSFIILFWIPKLSLFSNFVHQFKRRSHFSKIVLMFRSTIRFNILFTYIKHFCIFKFLRIFQLFSVYFFCSEIKFVPYFQFCFHKFKNCSRFQNMLWKFKKCSSFK